MCIHLLLHLSTTLANLPYKRPDFYGKCETLLVCTSGYLDVLQLHLLVDLCRNWTNHIQCNRTPCLSLWCPCSKKKVSIKGHNWAQWGTSCVMVNMKATSFIKRLTISQECRLSCMWHRRTKRESRSLRYERETVIPARKRRRWLNKKIYKAVTTYAPGEF